MVDNIQGRGVWTSIVTSCEGDDRLCNNLPWWISQEWTDVLPGKQNTAAYFPPYRC